MGPKLRVTVRQPVALPQINIMRDQSNRVLAPQEIE